MPLFFQHVIDDATQLAIWKIEEDEVFFSRHVPLQRAITHPHKRLQHLAGRYLLKYLFPDFPIALIQIADTRKPFLEDEAYHFSISHCGDFAGVIVSKHKRVGIDIELVKDKIVRIQHKFVNQEEWMIVNRQWSFSNIELINKPGERSWDLKKDFNTPPTETNIATISPVNLLTLLWSCKEAAFKWYGLGEVDFKQHMEVKELKGAAGNIITVMAFKKNEDQLLDLHSCFFNDLVLSYVVT